MSQSKAEAKRLMVEKIRQLKAGEYDIDLFLTENERIVHHIIQRLTGSGLIGTSVYNDLFNQGLYGLYKAVLEFDEEVGTDFWSLGYPYILNAVSAAYYDEFKRGGKRNFRENVGINEDLKLAYEDDYDYLMNPEFYEVLATGNLDILLSQITITDKQREALEVYLETYSFSEAARILGTSRQSVHQRVEVIQKRLREKFLIG